MAARPPPLPPRVQPTSTSEEEIHAPEVAFRPRLCGGGRNPSNPTVLICQISLPISPPLPPPPPFPRRRQQNMRAPDAGFPKRTSSGRYLVRSSVARP